METTCSIFWGKRPVANVRCADTFFARLKGLLGKSGLNSGEGLLITPCNQIHSFAMKFEFDALFLSRDGTVLHAMEYIKPNRISPMVRGCSQVLELAAGSIRQNEIGVRDKLTVSRSER